MSFLLDTNIMSAYIKRPSQVVHRIVQNSGRLSIPTMVLAELLVWAHHRSDPESILGPLRSLLPAFELLDFDTPCAIEYSSLKTSLGSQGLTVDTPDLIIASTALAHDLTLVTHNTADFDRIPGLRLEDWLLP